MAIAHVASAGAASTDGISVSTGAINSTGANLLVAALSWKQGSNTWTDSKSNTWAGLTQQVVAGGEIAQLFYVVGSPTVGSGHTLDVSFADSPSAFLFAFSGAGSYEQETGADTFGSTLQPGSMTPASAGALVFQMLAFNVSGTLSIDGSYTGLLQQNLTANARGGAAAYLIQGAAAATNPTWTHSPGSSSLAARGAVFLASGGGGGSLPPYFEATWPEWR